MSELKTNKISPATGTALAVGDSGDTITVPSGATLTVSGTMNLPDDTVDIADLSATGTASATTFLRGDNSWVAAAGGLSSVQTFVSTGTWTKPSDILSVRVELVGGGGGGGGSASGSGIDGGAGGGYSSEIIDVSSVSTVAVTIGAGGAGGASGTNAGATGGTTSFGSYLSATGGTGGYTNDGGGTPGIGSDGDINIRGSGGQSARSGTATGHTILGGAGGSSMLGGGAPGKDGSGTGEDGGVYGGGGAGGNNGSAGGAGAAGFVIVWEYK